MTKSADTFNLADLYEAVADTCPARTALVADPPTGEQDAHRFTFADLDERANRVAHALRAAGAAASDHVAILARNRAEWLESMLGCWKARMATVNLNHRYLVDELMHVLSDSDAVALIAEPDLLAPLRERLTQLPQLRCVFALADSTPEDTGGPDDGVPDNTARVVRYEEALATASPTREPGPRSGDDHYLLYTGGTTGPPKGVLWRHEDIFFAALGGGAPGGEEPIARPAELADRVPTEPTRNQVHAPLMHGGAQWAALRALTTGNTVVLGTGQHFDPHAALALAEREHSHVLVIVGNSMAGPLADALATDPGRYDLSAVRALGSGGAPLSDRTRDRLQQHLPWVQVRDHLGVSETGAVGLSTTGPSADSRRRFTPGPEFTVLDVDLRPVPAGSNETGVLARRGHIPLAYYNDPERSARTFVQDANGVRWALQGDQATPNEDGTITFLGRSSQVINSGGEKVHAEEVETALRTHRSIEDAIVTGIDDERLGSRVAALVVSATRTSADDVAQHCRGQLAAYKVPRTIMFTDELPRTAVGKPDHAAAGTLLASVRRPGTNTPARPKQLDSPVMPTLFKHMAKTQTWLYQRTGGRIGGKWRIGAGFHKPVPVALLEHQGRKSGKRFVTPLLHMLDGMDIIIVASQGGLPGNPQWYRNLAAQPDTHIQRGPDRIPVRARTAEPAERSRLWPLLVSTYADFDTYQSWTERVIPVVILEPRKSG